MKARMLVAGGVILVAVLTAYVALSSNVPQLINYQGRLTDGAGDPVTGNQSIRFKVLNGDTPGASVLWSETQTVTVTDGVYHVLLGSVNPMSQYLFKGPNRYLEVEVNGETLSPRQQLGSVPYAMACDPTTLYLYKDYDKDGHRSMIFGGDDCNDGDATIYRGAPEIPHDGIDQSCDGYPFGPLDACNFLTSCGMIEGSLDQCLAELQPDYAAGGQAFSDFASCLEGATCGAFDACFGAMQIALVDQMCTYLEGCGYLDYTSCSTDVENNWDGWLELMLNPLVCLQDSGTCSAEGIEQCLTFEQFQYRKNQQLRTWGNSNGYDMSAEVYVLFSSPSDTYTIRSPQGSVMPMSTTGDWGWYGGSGFYTSWGDLVNDWPAGPYQLEKSGTPIDYFEVPAPDESGFTKQFYNVTPETFTGVDLNPLRMSWILSYPGQDPAYLRMMMQNTTRSTMADIDQSLDPSLTSADVPIPSGTLYGDSLEAYMTSESVKENFSNTSGAWFIRQYAFAFSPAYVWTGSAQ